MMLDSTDMLNVDLLDGTYKLYYEWPSLGRGKKIKQDQLVKVVNGKINEDHLLKAAKIYQEKSGLLDDNWIENIEIIRAGKPVIKYTTGS